MKIALPALLKQPKIYLPIALLFVLVIGINLFVYLHRSSLLAPRSPKGEVGTPTPAQIKDIPGGKQIYNVSNGSKVTGPKISQVIIDPQTPTTDQSQTVTLTIKNDTPITQGQITLQTDTKEQIRVLKLISGTPKDGTWQVTWKFGDTYDHNYVILFDIKSPSGEYKNGMRLR